MDAQLGRCETEGHVHLTPRQRYIRDTIVQLITELGGAPTELELALRLGISLKVTSEHLAALEKKRAIRRRRNSDGRALPRTMAVVPCSKGCCPLEGSRAG